MRNAGNGRAVMAVAGLMLAGCSAGAKDAKPNAGSTPDSPPGEKITVVARDNAFEPVTLSSPPGTKVTVVFKNDGALPHTFTVKSLGADTGIVNAGATKEVNLTVPSGPTPFVCTIHLEMTGTLSPS
jgi:plastocyanin